MRFKLKVIWNLLILRFSKRRYQFNLEKLQEKRWRKMNKTLISSPFYQELAAKKTPLRDYPLMNKERFMKNFSSINTKGIDRNEAVEIALKAESSRDFSPMINKVTIGLSTGTSGNRGVFLATENERAQWVACVLDRVIGFSLQKRSVAFFLRANSNLYDSVKSQVLAFEFFDLLEQVDVHVHRLNALKPTFLVAQPSLLLELAKGKELGTLTIEPSKIISVAEVLYPEDKAFLELIFNQTIHQVYQCTEGMLATTCLYGTLHLNEDFLVIEKLYIDKEKKRFHPIITDLLRSSQPFVRYELNDILHEKKDCPCGSKFTAIEKIEGRSDDILTFETTNNLVSIFPDFFRRALIFSHENIVDYTLAQISAKELELYVNHEDLFPPAKNALSNLLASHGIQNVTIKYVSKKHHEMGNKLRRIRNDIRKAN